MSDDNELRLLRWTRLFSQEWVRLFFCDERGYSHKEELRFQWRKVDLIETEKHGRLLKVLGNCASQVVLELYVVQAWGLLWCFYSDGLSEQQYHTDYTGPSFQVWQFEFPSRLFFNPWIGRSVVQHSWSKMVESRLKSDRSSLHIERACFNQLSPCCDHSDDVFDIMVFNIFLMNLLRNLNWRHSSVNHSFSSERWRDGCLICVSFVLQDPP